MTLSNHNKMSNLNQLITFLKEIDTNLDETSITSLDIALEQLN